MEARSSTRLYPQQQPCKYDSSFLMATIPLAIARGNPPGKASAAAKTWQEPYGLCQP